MTREVIGANLTLGSSTTLFTLTEPFVLQDVTSDGRRFLILDSPTAADWQPIHVVTDGRSVLTD